MHIGLLNPQGNFDPKDSYWTQHPDFGGQLVYVKNVAIELARRGHRVDILTRQIIDPAWPEFRDPLDAYPGVDGVRIVRLPAGPKKFLPKEALWPYIGQDWVPAILAFYHREGRLPDLFSSHYGDGGLAGVLIEAETHIPFTFTAHSLGAQKMEKLGVTRENLAHWDAIYHFRERLVAERLSMNRSDVNIASTRLERFEQYGHRAYQGAVDVQDDRRFEIIPPGVNLDIFDAETRAMNEDQVYATVAAYLRRDLAPDRLQLPAIVASSRLDPKKNHVALVRAYAQSRRLQDHANLVLITAGLEDPLRDDNGASPTERAILRQIRGFLNETGLWGNVSAFALRGQPALAAAYRYFARQHSVFALTALYEPFGLAPLEAAVAGLPLVVTRNGGPAESLREGKKEFAVLVDPEDPADIARGLEHLILSADAWSTFARKGRLRVLHRYTWSHTARGYERILREILRAPHARRAFPLLPIPAYFRAPRSQHKIPLEELVSLYFGE
jgi:Glycosyltransferase